MLHRSSDGKTRLLAFHIFVSIRKWPVCKLTGCTNACLRVGTVLEIGDGWASNDSRRWNGEYKRFALYTEPKSADDVATMYAAFEASGGPGGGGH
jgi:hypothetical protein